MDSVMDYAVKTEDVWPRELASCAQSAAMCALAEIKLDASENRVPLFVSRPAVAALHGAPAEIIADIRSRGMGLKPYENGGGLASSPEKLIFVRDELRTVAGKLEAKEIDAETAASDLRDFYQFNLEVTSGRHVDSEGRMMTFGGFWTIAEDAPDEVFDVQAAHRAIASSGITAPSAAKPRTPRRRAFRMPFKLHSPILSRIFGGDSAARP